MYSYFASNISCRHGKGSSGGSGGCVSSVDGCNGGDEA